MPSIQPPTGRLGDHLATFFGPGRLHFRVVVDTPGDWRGDRELHATFDKRTGDLVGITRDMVEDRHIRQTPDVLAAIERFEVAGQRFVATAPAAERSSRGVDFRTKAGDFVVGVWDNDAPRTDALDGTLFLQSGRIDGADGELRDLVDAATAVYAKI